MGIVKEFKVFAMKGNVMDLAVGIIIGAAFGKIVTSLVGDIIMPLVGAITGSGSLGDKLLYLGRLGDWEKMSSCRSRLSERKSSVVPILIGDHLFKQPSISSLLRSQSSC